MCFYTLTTNDYKFDGGVQCAKQDSKATRPFILDCVSTEAHKPLAAQTALAKEWGQKLAADFYATWEIITTCVALSLPLCFIWIFILRCLAPFFIYLILFGMFSGSIGSTAFMWMAYQEKIVIQEAIAYK